MIIHLIQTIFKVYYYLIFIEIIISWVPVDQYNQWVQMLHKITDPYLDIFRKIIPPIGMIDISPIVALMALGLIEKLLISLLYTIGIF